MRAPSELHQRSYAICNCSPSRGTSCRMAHRFCRKTRPSIWSLGSHTSPYAGSSFEREHSPRSCKAGRFSWIFLLEVASAGYCYCHAYTMLDPGSWRSSGKFPEQIQLRSRTKLRLFMSPDACFLTASPIQRNKLAADLR